MTIKVGDKVPSATLRKLGESGIDQVDTDSLFKGKTVAVFAVPGAFTPTCSAQHLPSFVDNAAKLKEKGVDEIVCMAVNDPFVMAAWGKSQPSGNVELMSDGNGEFSKKLGLEMDGSGFGLGTRSQRFSMLVEDGVVKQLNVEEPGAYEVSSAEHMLQNM